MALNGVPSLYMAPTSCCCMRTRSAENRSGPDEGRATLLHAHRLKHRVGIFGLLGDFLTHVPMLDHLATFETENIDDGIAAAAGGRHVVDVKDHVVTNGKGPFYLAAKVGK